MAGGEELYYVGQKVDRRTGEPGSKAMPLGCNPCITKPHCQAPPKMEGAQHANSGLLEATSQLLHLGLLCHRREGISTVL